MSDTIIDPGGRGRSGTTQGDEDVPDTLSEPLAPYRAAEPAKSPLRAMPAPGRSILKAIAAGAAIVLGALALGLYLFVLRYEPTARRHIPGNAQIALRVDFARVILFGPVREHLWPVVTGEGNGPPPPGPTRLERIHDATGIDLARDPRELVVASTDGTSWVAIVGGRFERGRFVHGLERVARKEQWPGFHLEGDLLVGPGVAIAQADDGTLIAGSNTSVVVAALTPSDEYRRLDLADDAALSFAVTREAWSGASGVAGAVLQNTSLAHIERATGKVTLSDSPEVTLHVEPRQGEPVSEVSHELETALAALRIATLLTPDLAGEKGALAAAKVTTSPDGNAVVVTAAWPYEGLDRGCARVATLLRAVR